MPYSFRLQMQSAILWNVSLNGDLQSVKRILSIKKANPNWMNPHKLVSIYMYNHVSIMAIVYLTRFQFSQGLFLTANCCHV